MEATGDDVVALLEKAESWWVVRCWGEKAHASPEIVTGLQQAKIGKRKNLERRWSRKRKRDERVGSDGKCGGESERLTKKDERELVGKA